VKGVAGDATDAWKMLRRFQPNSGNVDASAMLTGEMVQGGLAELQATLDVTPLSELSRH